MDTVVARFSYRPSEEVVTRVGDDITITNLGTNPAFVNNTPLDKDTSTKIHHGDVITLVEKEHEVLVELPTHVSMIQEKSRSARKRDSPAAAAGGSSSTTSHLRPPPPLPRTGQRQHVWTSDSSPTGAGGTEKPKADAPPSSKIAAIAIASSATTVAAASATHPTNTTSSRVQGQGQGLTDPQHQRDTYNSSRMEVDDVSENTSDSDNEPVDANISRYSDISDESSIVCENLSDRDFDSHDEH
ncbi:hypothetical protein BGX23_011906 [Mortierella sp. AD031]|nr:hypothetical protein BGX23_011906 [Mortierella sp. AD031]